MVDGQCTFCAIFSVFIFLSDLTHLVDLLSSFTREITSVTSCLLSAHQIPSEKGYSKRKEFAPRGSKFFPFRVDPEGRLGKKSFSEGCLLFFLNGKQINSFYSRPLFRREAWEQIL